MTKELQLVFTFTMANLVGCVFTEMLTKARIESTGRSVKHCEVNALLMMIRVTS